MGTKLIILGEGELKDELNTQIDTLGLNDLIDIHEFVDNPYAYMRHSDLFVLTSQNEAFGNVIVESLACGTPVIVSESPYGQHGPPEIISNGKYGTIIPPGNYRKLAEEIENMLHNEQNTDKLKNRAKEFSIENIINEYESIFDLT